MPKQKNYGKVIRVRETIYAQLQERQKTLQQKRGWEIISLGDTIAHLLRQAK